MTEKRMLIVDEDVISKIDQNRGDMTRSEFITFLINSQLSESVSADSNLNSVNYVEREEFQEFAQGMKDLLRRFLDFFISYGMELGEEPKDNTFNELVQKLQTLSASSGRSSKSSK
jgi:hypothetical protein